jgi:hypothetical protein
MTDDSKALPEFDDTVDEVRKMLAATTRPGTGFMLERDEVGALLSRIDSLQAELAAERAKVASLAELVRSKEIVHAADDDLRSYEHGNLRDSINAIATERDNLRAALAKVEAERDDASRPRALDDWHEEDGGALWWKFPIVEPPYVGSPLSEDFPEYVTHWTPLPLPKGTTEP